MTIGTTSRPAYAWDPVNNEWAPIAGLPGAPGPTGATGPVGSTGATGATGASGPGGDPDIPIQIVMGQYN